MQLWAADVGNASLEALTKEKIYVIAGPEFGVLEGHILLIHKALYGLCTSGARWHEHFADTLRDLGFIPCKADPDVWMKNCGTHNEYICVYVDDLAIAMRNPQEFIEVLVNDCGYKLKGVDRWSIISVRTSTTTKMALSALAPSPTFRDCSVPTNRSLGSNQRNTLPPLIAMTILNWIPPMSCLSWISSVFSC